MITGFCSPAIPTGPGKGKLIIPGGYVLKGESPEQALVREFLEETRLSVQPLGLLGVRFNPKDWYVIFLAAYRDGVPRSDGVKTAKYSGWMRNRRCCTMMCRIFPSS